MQPWTLNWDYHLTSWFVFKSIFLTTNSPNKLFRRQNHMGYFQEPYQKTNKLNNSDKSITFWLCSGTFFFFNFNWELGSTIRSFFTILDDDLLYSDVATVSLTWQGLGKITNFSITRILTRELHQNLCDLNKLRQKSRNPTFGLSPTTCPFFYYTQALIASCKLDIWDRETIPDTHSKAVA